MFSGPDGAVFPIVFPTKCIFVLTTPHYPYDGLVNGGRFSTQTITKAKATLSHPNKGVDVKYIAVGL